MRRSFNRRDPQTIVRGIVGLLLVANLVAVGLVLFPPGGSAEDLERQFISLQTQIRSRSAALATTRLHAAAVEKGRSEGDQFLDGYFLPTRTAFSTIIADLDADASQTKIRARDASYSLDPIEGSDTLSLMSITAAYEGTYADVLHFVHEIDKSERLLIIESLNAAPIQGPGKLITVSLKLDTFVRGDGSEPITPQKSAGE